MSASYNPTAVEWLSLDTFLVTALLPWAILALSAHGFRWKSWWENDRIMKPSIMWHPMAYSALFFLIYGAAGVGGWFIWREGFRSENTPPDPSSGNIPSETNYFLANIFYICFWIFSCFIGPCFFIFSLEMKVMAGSCILSFIVFGLAVALTVMGFLIWFVPGILFLVVAVFCAFQFIICCAFYKDFRYDAVQHPHGVTELAIYNVSIDMSKRQQGQGQENMPRMGGAVGRTYPAGGMGGNFAKYNAGMMINGNGGAYPRNPTQ